jgi:Ser/Thr protein kinase RdoA (MazF antagonist)
LHLENKGLPVPKVIRSLSGATEMETAAGLLRVLSYLDGVPMHLGAFSFARAKAMGIMAARLSAGLADFSHPGADHILQWDIRQAAALRPLLPDVPDDLRAACTVVLNRFEAQIAPQLADLPWQVVHNDLNPHNVLVAADAPDKIAGVLDFGDMVRTPRVCDLAVAASYQIGPDDALTSLASFAAAFHATLPLTRAEVGLVADLTATRMATTIAIASWRARQYPENAGYILRNLPSARAGLHALAALPRRETHETLLRACAMEPL